MGVLAGVIKDAISNVGLFNGGAYIAGTFTGESCDSNGVWVWGLHTTTIVIPGQSLSFRAYGHISQDQAIPTPGPDGNVWMVAALQREPPQTTSCFTGGVRVIMEDGNEKFISEIRIGDFVLGQDGKINQVTAIETPFLGKRLLYSINETEAFVTAEHPFCGEFGWHSIDPAATLFENSELKVQSLKVGDRVRRFRSIQVPSIQQDDEVLIANIRNIATKLDTINKITSVKASPDTRLFNLILDGNNTYYANGFLVHNKNGH